ncbi:hypothetical protein PIB30_005613 [Stylosanthes scabra]|uniref:DUF3741 domain-containing protein n=1 Tax=Stylosanthes scabra TaxID=79078 RepID=A0ABU6S3X3_9FABA|nr:hypothetical protein [Stylosanthes scabra]
MSQAPNAKHRCFSGFLHTLLCDGNGNISDQIIESYETHQVHPRKSAMVNAASTPGLIVRLMGLDSMPNNPNSEFKETIPDSVPRSKSMNFLDYILEFDDASQSNHRRAKISASSREVPELFRRKNRREVLVPCWDSGRRDSKEGKSRKICKLKNEPRIVKNGCSKFGRSYKDSNSSHRKSDCGSRSSTRMKNKQIEELFEPKQMKNMRMQWSKKKIEIEYSSQDLTSVSILDINDYKYLYGPDFLDYTRPLMSATMWESSEKQFLGNGIEDRAMKDKGYTYPYIHKEQKECPSELEMKLFNLIENDMKDLYFTKKGMCEAERFEEIGLVYEHHIFNTLLHEIVNELVETF